MNGAIAIIDVYWLVRLQRERHDEAAYQVLEVGPDDAYLTHTLRTHAADIARFYPSFALVDPAPDGRTRHAFLVLKGDETVGVVVARDGGDGVAHIELDYVTPRFRDFTPGEFVYAAAACSLGTASPARRAARRRRRAGLLRAGRLHRDPRRLAARRGARPAGGPRRPAGTRPDVAELARPTRSRIVQRASSRRRCEVASPAQTAAVHTRPVHGGCPPAAP